MRASVPRSWPIALLSVLAATASAQGVYLPPPPNGPGGEDTIETASGARCRQSMNSNGAYLDVGLTGRTANGESRTGGFYGNSQPGQEAIGYARVTLPLGERPKRIDCSRLYELEIARMQREIELLKMAAE